MNKEKIIYQEAFIGFLGGAVYGITSLIVGHPLDTIKTKMQAQKNHLTNSSFNVVIKTLKNEGIVGLYRGCIPPLLGSSILRSVQFGVFATVYTLLSQKKSIPNYSIYAINTNLILAGMASGAARAIVECPLEVAKIRRQIGETWKFLGLYKGLGVNMARNIPLLSFFFIFLEISKNYDMPSNLRPFISGSICSTLAWTLIWPFDVIKSQIQGSTGNESLFQKIKIHYKNFGIFGFFRGYVPGAIRSLLANGLSMVALVKTQQYLENYFRLSK